MAIVLWNPTNEEMKSAYDGVEYRIQPGQKIKANDKMARHLLHKLHDIGLARLDYGDESREEQIGDEGRERFRQFKLKQINNFNEDNYLRSQTKRQPIRSDERLRRWADELGETLFSGVPVSKTEQEERHSKLWAENEGLRKENKTLKEKVDSMESKLDLLLSKIGATEEYKANVQMKEEETRVAEAEDLNQHREWLKNLKGQQLIAFMKETPDEYSKLPIQIQEELRDKWKRVLDKPFPQ